MLPQAVFKNTFPSDKFYITTHHIMLINYYSSLTDLKVNI